MLTGGRLKAVFYGEIAIGLLLSLAVSVGPAWIFPKLSTTLSIYYAVLCLADLLNALLLQQLIMADLPRSAPIANNVLHLLSMQCSLFALSIMFIRPAISASPPPTAIHVLFLGIAITELIVSLAKYKAKKKFTKPLVLLIGIVILCQSNAFTVLVFLILSSAILLFNKLIERCRSLAMITRLAPSALFGLGIIAMPFALYQSGNALTLVGTMLPALFTVFFGSVAADIDSLARQS